MENEKWNSSAIAYRDLKKGSEIGNVILKFEKSFSTKNEYRNFRDSSSLKVTALWHNISDDKYNAEFEMDSVYQNRVIEYWKTNFVKGEVNLYLKNEANLMMTSKVEIDTILRSENNVTFKLKTTEDPKLSIGIVELK